jgi:hypothetical protein
MPIKNISTSNTLFTSKLYHRNYEKLSIKKPPFYRRALDGAMNETLALSKWVFSALMPRHQAILNDPKVS